MKALRGLSNIDNIQIVLIQMRTRTLYLALNLIYILVLRYLLTILVKFDIVRVVARLQVAAVLPQPMGDL